MKADYHWIGEISYTYNPCDLPEDSLPIIYGFSGQFSNAGAGRIGVLGILLTEDGVCLGKHVHSSEGQILHNLLAVRVDRNALTKAQKKRREDFENHYPKGYRLTFVKASDVPEHKGLAEANKKYQASIVKKVY